MRALWLREGWLWTSRSAARVASAARPIDAGGSIPSAEPGLSYLDASLRLTAIALLLRPMGPWFVRPVLLATAVLVLIFPRLLRSSVVWGGVALLVTIRIADDWPLADNHIYLLGYWSFAIALALGTSDRWNALAFSSRWLICLAFAFAVLWKAVLSPDFLDGRFFRVTLLTDPRFDAVTQLIGGLSREELTANRAALAPLPDGAELLNPPPIHETVRLRALANASTFGILLLEATVALAMAVPTTTASVGFRHGALLLFCGITYAFAPVAGFGWLLLVMGLAQVDPRRLWLGRAYIAMFLAVLFFGEVPWAELTLDLVR